MNKNTKAKREIPLTFDVKRDLWSKDKFESQILPVPKDAVGSDGTVIATFPVRDENGEEMDYHLEDKSNFNLFYLGVVRKSKKDLRSDQGRRNLEVSEVSQARNRNLNAAENYELRYVGVNTNADGTKLNFQLQVYNSSGGLISDQSYEIPVQGTKAEHALKNIPFISDSGTVTILQSQLFGRSGLDNSALPWYTTEKETFTKPIILLIIFACTFYLPGWAM